MIYSPLILLKRITIPLLDDDYSKYMISLSWIITPLIIMLLLDINLWILEITLIILSIFFLISKSLFYTNRWFTICLSFYSFLISCFYIYLISKELVGILSALGIICNISYSILGLTLLSWGIVTPDAVNNITLAKNISIQMAISACIAGSYV